MCQLEPNRGRASWTAILAPPASETGALPPSHHHSSLATQDTNAASAGARTPPLAQQRGPQLARTRRIARGSLVCLSQSQTPRPPLPRPKDSTQASKRAAADNLQPGGDPAGAARLLQVRSGKGSVGLVPPCPSLTRARPAWRPPNALSWFSPLLRARRVPTARAHPRACPPSAFLLLLLSPLPHRHKGARGLF